MARSTQQVFNQSTRFAKANRFTGNRALVDALRFNLECALGTAGRMRHALALHRTAQHQAFGKSLAEQPLMKNFLADLAIEREAATALALRLARAG